MLCSHAILALARALTQFTGCAGTIVPILTQKVQILVGQGGLCAAHRRNAGARAGILSVLAVLIQSTNPDASLLALLVHTYKY